MLVGNPLIGRTAVISIEHGGHRINSQTVNPIAFDPKKGVAHQKITDLMTPPVVNQGIPVPMKTFLGVRVLVEGCAIESSHGMGIGWKVSGNPVEYQLQTGFMDRLNKSQKRRRRAVTRCWCVETGGLISPGGIERMLMNGKQFDVGKTHLHNIGHEVLCKKMPICKLPHGLTP